MRCGSALVERAAARRSRRSAVTSGSRLWSAKFLRDVMHTSGFVGWSSRVPRSYPERENSPVVRTAAQSCRKVDAIS